MKKQIGSWFLVGSRFDSGQNTLWNIEDEPFNITPPYIHFGDGKKYLPKK